MKKAILTVALLATVGAASAQGLSAGWSYGSFGDRMTDKTEHMAVLQSDDRSSQGFDKVVLQCVAGKPDSATAHFMTSRTYLGSDGIRYAYRLDSAEVVNDVANNSIYNQAVAGNKKGVKVASGKNAVELAKKLSTVKSISTTVNTFEGRIFSGNFDNVQVRVDKLQSWISACGA